MKPAVLAMFVAFVFAGCFASSPQVTRSGKGLPEVSITFPPETDVGTIETALLMIANPGPGDIPSMIVAFTLVGAAGSERLPQPLVAPGAERGDSAIVSVAPTPDAVSRDGSTYRFGPLDVGDTVTIEFRIRIPDSPGVAANSVTVYDVQDAERGSGVLLQTTIQR